MLDRPGLTHGGTASPSDASSPSDPSTSAPPGTVPGLREGQDYTTIASLPLSTAGKNYTYYGLTDDGLAYGSKSEVPLTGTDDLTPTSAVLTDLTSGLVTPISDGTDRPAPTQFTGMAYSPGFVVWIETTSTSLDGGDWALYVHDRAADTTRLAATSTDTGADNFGAIPPGGVTPSITNGYIYLDAAGKTDGTTSFNVYRTRLDRPSRLSLVATKAEGAFASRARIIYRTINGAIKQIDTEGNEVEPLGGAQQVDNPCGGFFAEGTLVVCEKLTSPDLVLHIYRDKHEPIDLDLRGRAIHYIQGTSRWVRYELDGTTYVYDLKRQRLMKVTDLYSAALGQGPGDVFDVATIDEAAGETRAEKVTFMRLIP